MKYKIQLFTDWQTGSGLAGTRINDTVIKDKDGFPFLPGRTIKGLLRDAATQLLALKAPNLSQEFINDVFGRSEEQLQQREIYQYDSCHFTNASLHPSLVAKLGPKHRKHLFRTLSSTAINEQGLALDKSLRVVEVAIPMVLYGTIENFPDNNEYEEAMKQCFQWVKGLGNNRFRGLGRCLISPI